MSNINDQRTAVYHRAAKRCSFATHFENNFEQSGVILWTVANKVKAAIRIYGWQKQPNCYMPRKAINIFSSEPCKGNCAVRDAVYLVDFTAFFFLSVPDMRHIPYFNSHVCKNNFRSFKLMDLWDLLPNYYAFSRPCTLAHVATICDALQHNCFGSTYTKYKKIYIKVTMNSIGAVQQWKRSAAKTKPWKLQISTRLLDNSKSTGLTHFSSTCEWNTKNSYIRAVILIQGVTVNGHLPQCSYNVKFTL